MLALALLLAPLQDHALPPGPDDDPGAAPVTRPIVPKRDCRSSGDEVVICADPDAARFRLRQPGFERYAEPPVRARMRMLGGEGSVDAVERSIGNVSVPSLMFTFRLPFGGKPKARDPDE